MIQREEETPDAFWVCLLEAGVLYAHLDINNPKDQWNLASVFIDQSGNDIRSHFQIIISMTLEIPELCTIANFMFDQREKLKRRGREKRQKGKEKERGKEGQKGGRT